VEKLLEDTGYQITKTEEFVLLKIVPWRIVVAKPLTG
jgi:hypothetical protein